MAKFDQRGQNVVNQVNTDMVDKIHFGDSGGVKRLREAVLKVENEVNWYLRTRDIEKDVLEEVNIHLKKILNELEHTNPRKNTILRHLKETADMLTGISEAAGVVTALLQVMKVVGDMLK